MITVDKFCSLLEVAEPVLLVVVSSLFSSVFMSAPRESSSLVSVTTEVRLVRLSGLRVLIGDIILRLGAAFGTSSSISNVVDGESVDSKGDSATFLTWGNI